MAETQAFDLDAAEGQKGAKPFDLDAAEGGPPKPPASTPGLFGLPKYHTGDPLRDLALAQNISPHAAGNAVLAGASLPFVGASLPEAARRLVTGVIGSTAGGYGGKLFGRHAVGPITGDPEGAAQDFGLVGSIIGGGWGGIKGPAALQDIAETMPKGYVGQMARAALKLLGFSEKRAGEVAGNLTQQEAAIIARNALKPPLNAGGVAGPPVEEVAQGMRSNLDRVKDAERLALQIKHSLIRPSENPPLTQAEMAQAVKGASGGPPTPPAAVGANMTPAGEVAPFQQGEAGKVVSGIGKPASGWVENPSPAQVAKEMQTAPVDTTLDYLQSVHGLSKRQALDLTKKIAEKGLEGGAAGGPPAPPTALTPTPSAPTPTDRMKALTQHILEHPEDVTHVQNEINSSTGPYREALRKALRAAIDQMGGG